LGGETLREGRSGYPAVADCSGCAAGRATGRKPLHGANSRKTPARGVGADDRTFAGTNGDEE